MDTEEKGVVAEEPSSEPTAKNYSLREELAQNRGVLRSPCGRFEQSDTGESCGVEMAERVGYDLSLPRLWTHGGQSETQSAAVAEWHFAEHRSTS
jgi:hypothetical protein